MRKFSGILTPIPETYLKFNVVTRNLHEKNGWYKVPKIFFAKKSGACRLKPEPA